MMVITRMTTSQAKALVWKIMCSALDEIEKAGRNWKSIKHPSDIINQEKSLDSDNDILRAYLIEAKENFINYQLWVGEYSNNYVGTSYLLIVA